MDKPPSISVLMFVAFLSALAYCHNDGTSQRVLDAGAGFTETFFVSVDEVLASLPRNKVMHVCVVMTACAFSRGRSPSAVHLESARRPDPDSEKRQNPCAGKRGGGGTSHVTPTPNREACLMQRNIQQCCIRLPIPAHTTNQFQPARADAIARNDPGKRNKLDQGKWQTKRKAQKHIDDFGVWYMQKHRRELIHVLQRYGKTSLYLCFIMCYYILHFGIPKHRNDTPRPDSKGSEDLIDSERDKDEAKTQSTNAKPNEREGDKAYVPGDGLRQKRTESTSDNGRVMRVGEIPHLLALKEEAGFCDGEAVELIRTYVEDSYEYKLEHPPNNPNNRDSPGLAREYSERSLSEVESDGRISDHIGDPPGQQTIYIRPGDVRLESYRLSTFENFPITTHAMRRNLAKAGFIFTGYFDRVKCYACARCVEQLDEGDDPSDHTWHKPNCPMACGICFDNVPLTTSFTSRLPASASNSQVVQQRQLQQRDPVSGNVTRTVRYPADLPERIRNNGGTFQIGPGNTVIIQSGPTPGYNRQNNIGNRSAPAPRWRMANVVSADHRRFLTNLYLNRELDRLTSFARWPMSRPNVTPAALAKSGFFYLGDMDRTQCFSCGGVLRNWTLEDDAEEEHRTHFPHCPFMQGRETRNVPIPLRDESSEELATNYPCRYASSPHMRGREARLDTFNHGWPANRISATPESIAEAGFFFLGERDRVKCWYCNGGLQNWEQEDVPWEEHAKWFPNCQFLLRTKGQNFVYRQLAMNPHLARPIIARQEGSAMDPAAQAGEIARPMDVAPPAGPMRQATPPPVIIDPREEMRKKKEKVDNAMQNSEKVRNIVGMGFSEELVRQVIEDSLDAVGAIAQSDGFDSASALLDAVMAKEEELKREAEENARQVQRNHYSFESVYSTNAWSMAAHSSLETASGSGRFDLFADEPVMMDDKDMYSSSEPSSNPEPRDVSESFDRTTIREKLKKIQEERMCKICFSNDADIVFIPCGHLCCCADCTQSIRQCPMCRKKIEKAIKTYST